MQSDERQYLILALMRVPTKHFLGTIEDMTRLQTMICAEEFTDKDDLLLNRLYGAHVQVILECFTCFKQGVPMRLIKLDETTIRIICESCRENLHQAQSN